jgi:bifunctional enzyme CysN/CysC
MGTPASGILRPGDEVMALPSGHRSRIRSVLDPHGEVEEGFPPVPITVVLEDEIDVSRGDMLVHPRNVPHVGRQVEAMLVWMAEAPLELGRPYVVKHTTRKTPATIRALRYRMDMGTMRRTDADGLSLNEIGRVVVETARPLAWDSYRANRATGAFIVMDRLTHNTVAAGMILAREPNVLQVDPALRVEEAASGDVESHASRVALAERNARVGHGSATLWLTGLTGSGKSTISYALERRLHDLGAHATVLDGENMRLGVSKDLGFAPNERAEHNRRAAEIARLFNEAGLIAICAFLSPFEEERGRAREIVGAERFLEIHLSAPIETCRSRDPRGLWARADGGEIEQFPGVTAPYEAPTAPALTLPTHEIDVETSVDRILDLLVREGVLENV